MTILEISSETAGLLTFVGAVVVAALLTGLLGTIFKAAQETDNVFATGFWVLVLVGLVIVYAYVLFAVVT